MNFDATEEQSLIRKTARDFAERTLIPRAQKRDEDETFPESELKELAGLGLLGVTVPESLGGAEADTLSYAAAMEELARGDASVAVAVSVTNMVAEIITKFGSDAQKKEHVKALTSGAHLCGSFALSEPEVGSDPAALATKAEKTPEGYRLTGTKQWVTSGDRAGVICVWAVTDPGKGHRGISAFLVPKGTKGLSVARIEEKMGLRGSSTAQLVFDGVVVGEDALLGEPGQGFQLAMAALDGGRIGIAAQALGVARFAYEAAVRYAEERATFGKPIFKHQAIGNMIADMATWLEGARVLIQRAAYLKDSGQRFTQQASQAKLFATERASDICDRAIQIHGGYGYTKDFPVERAYRDARVTRIYEGTSEIQRLVIARNLLKEARA